MSLTSLGLVYLLLLGLAIGWVLVVVYTAWLLTHPPRRGYAYAVSRSLPGDPGECLGKDAKWSTWTFRSPTGGGDLPVWDIAGQSPRGPVVIITHGWGDSRVVMLSRLPTIAKSASRVLVWDQPGHGDAPGSCALGSTEAEDLIALCESTGHTPIVLYGYSLGAGVSIVAAAALGEKVAGVIAEAPYRVPVTPARNMLRLRGLPQFTTLRPALALTGMLRRGTLSWAFRGDAGGFDRALHAAKLHAETRLLVVHGERDAICPLDDGQVIANAGRGTLEVIPGGTHAGLWADQGTQAVVSQRMERFLEQLSRPA